MNNIHHGEILQVAVNSVGMSVTDLAEKFDVSRSTIYKMFSAETIDFYKLVRLGIILQYDFSEKIPEINMYKMKMAGDFSEASQNKKLLDLEACKTALQQYKEEAYKFSKELSHWKDKYIMVSEELAKLRLELAKK